MPAPLPARDVLDHFAFELNDHLADLWALRDAIDAELSGVEHEAAVAQIAGLAGEFLDAAERVRDVARLAGVTLVIDAELRPN